MYSFAKLATTATIVLFGAGLNHQNIALSQLKGIDVEIDSATYSAELKTNQLKYPARDFRLVFRPRGHQIVALVGEVEPGEYRLNPENFRSGSFSFDYEDIPALKDLTKAELDFLWGSPENTTSKYSSYALSMGPYAWYDYGPGNQKPDFVIDVKFKQNCLSAYRFRSRHLYSGWINL